MVLFHFFRVVIRNPTVINHVTKKHFSKSCYLFAGCGENIKKALLIPYQTERPKRPRRVTIVGAAGRAGVAVAYNLVRNQICDELILAELPERKKELCGEALDLLHGTPLIDAPKIKIAFKAEDTAKSDLIIVTCGIPRKPGQSRLDIVQTNVDIFKSAIPPLAKFSRDAVLLIVANPVDILTYTAWRYSCFDKNRVLGAGTEIDTSRFRYYIANRLGLNPSVIKADIIGEHGDSCVPLWSSASIGTARLRTVDSNIGSCGDSNHWNKLVQDVKDSGGKLNKWKGFTNSTIAVLVANIARAILTDSRTIHNVSVRAKGISGVSTECFMAFPAVLGNRGVHEIVQQIYDNAEKAQLINCACALDQAWQSVKF